MVERFATVAHCPSRIETQALADGSCRHGASGVDLIANYINMVNHCIIRVLRIVLIQYQFRRLNLDMAIKEPLQKSDDIAYCFCDPIIIFGVQATPRRNNICNYTTNRMEAPY
jgi:hypothetical protein